MLSKIISYELTQEDIDYLKFRACACLKALAETKDQMEKIWYWKLFLSYNDLYEENKHRVEKDNSY